MPKSLSSYRFLTDFGTVDDEPSVANRTLLVTSFRFPHLHACRYGNVPKRPLPHHSDDADGGDGDDGDGYGDDGDGDDGDGDADGGDGDLADRLDVRSPSGGYLSTAVHVALT